MTYSQIQSRVADYLNRSDLTTQIEDFIHFGQRAVERAARWNDMLATATGTLSAADYSITLPSRFLEVKTLHIEHEDTYYPVKMVTEADIIEIFPDLTDDTGRPVYFSILEPDSAIRLRPSCDQEYDYRLTYYRYSAELSGDNDTNWLTTNYPELLIYTALIEAAPFLHDDKRVEVWANKAGALMSNLVADQNMRFMQPNMDFYAR